MSRVSLHLTSSIRRALLALNLALALVFTLALAALTLSPASVERHVHRELVQRIATAAVERYPALRPARWTDGLAAVLRGDAAEIRAAMTSPELEALAGVLAVLCRHACSGEETAANRLREGLAERLRGIERAMQRVETWAQGHYRDLVDELLADLKVFCATNLVLCILAAVVVRVRERDLTGLFASAILTLTVTGGASLYLFEQNWLQTVLFADYVGYGYLVWVFVIGGALFDAAFNEGRVVSAFLGSLGALFG